jgi:FdhD protein
MIGQGRHGRASGITRVAVSRVDGSGAATAVDELSVEATLEIRVVSGASTDESVPVAVTMRTPGDDLDLAAGFLFTEGVIAGAQDLVELVQLGRNAVLGVLRPEVEVDEEALSRHSFVSSSCGACGKRLLESVRVAARHRAPAAFPRVEPEVVHRLPEALRPAQEEFGRTGGIHASGLFDTGGRLLALREDVGRHNALDKLIGAELRANRMPLHDRLVLVSGRVGFELVQKAAMAGVPLLGAVGAPSSMAVDLARQTGLTLVGFVRDGRFNVYADDGRIAQAAVIGEQCAREQLRDAP